VQAAQASELARAQGIDVAEAGRVQAAQAAEQARIQAAQAAENRASQQSQLQALGFSAEQAQQMVGFGEAGRAADIQSAQLLENIGRSQLGREQEALDIAYQDFVRQQAFPEQQLQTSHRSCAVCLYSRVSLRLHTLRSTRSSKHWARA
jgi:hypothetical protein